eukprot:gnl/TRDRNA2_/TRDRNA2_193495_c0_seq1.p1 gnl/TRDRNA2_/TRDRNA2_193495_c0~~gnl/TRDRNA2_/TRDRNA2_193495_c0_seq1.p1  ORF type:complete len:187 (-),score=34.05 gnl/TRDRNA2_/TRDRNA2_193495_c0_seq1:82-642(-)
MPGLLFKGLVRMCREAVMNMPRYVEHVRHGNPIALLRRHPLRWSLICLLVAPVVLAVAWELYGKAVMSWWRQSYCYARRHLMKRREDVYHIVLDKSDDANIGLLITVDGSNLCLPIQGICGGLATRWNESHPDDQVAVGDAILEVNGVKADVNAMMQKCKESQILVMKILRLSVQEGRCVQSKKDD